MLHPFSRTELLLGEQGMERLYGARVAIFGVGGVGGYVMEALARSGVGTLDLIDDDTVCLTNLNRQIIATQNTIGQYKVDVGKQRILDINPEAVVHTHKVFYTPETAGQFDFTQYDYIVDAIDSVTGKLELVERANQAGVPIISSMGAGNKMDPTAFRVADIYQTSVCPLARVMRRELKKRGIKQLKVVYSEETPIAPQVSAEVSGEKSDRPEGETRTGAPKRSVPGSNAFVPSVVGLIVAGEVIKDLTQWNRQ